MKTILSFCYRLYVPTQLLAQAQPGSRSGDLQVLIDRLTLDNGGCTLQQSQGMWYDEDKVPHHEAITVISWWFDGWNSTAGVASMVDAIVEAMFACGEKCVAVEYHNPHTPTRTELRVPEEETPPS